MIYCLSYVRTRPLLNAQRLSCARAFFLMYAHPCYVHASISRVRILFAGAFRFLRAYIFGSFMHVRVHFWVCESCFARARPFCVHACLFLRAYVIFVFDRLLISFKTFSRLLNMICETFKYTWKEVYVPNVNARQMWCPDWYTRFLYRDPCISKYLSTFDTH